jgi:hypothetical protein
MDTMMMMMMMMMMMRPFKVSVLCRSLRERKYQLPAEFGSM